MVCAWARQTVRYEVDQFDDVDLTAASANLRAGEVILNSGGYPWATNLADLGIELSVTVVDDTLDPSLILGDVVVNDDLVAELGLQAGDALDVTATGDVMIETLSALILLTMSVTSWRNIYVRGSLSNINVSSIHVVTSVSKWSTFANDGQFAYWPVAVFYRKTVERLWLMLLVC